MSYQFPYNSNESSNESVIESSDENTFYSQDLESQMMSDNAFQEQQAGPSVPPEQLENEANPYNGENFSNIPPALYEALYKKILQDVVNQSLNAQQVNHGQFPQNHYNQNFQHPQSSAHSVEGASRWATWNGSITSIDSHIFQLKVKIEEHRTALGTDRNVCLNIFETIPSDKHPRIINWFQTGGPDGKYSWENFLAHIKDQFGDKQARQDSGKSS